MGYRYILWPVWAGCILLYLIGCATAPLLTSSPPVLSALDEARLAFTLAQMSDQQGHYEKAINYYRRALYFDPQSNSLRSYLVWDLIRLGRFHEAISEYHQVLQDDPTDQRTPYILAQLHEATGNTAMAESLYRAAIARGHKDSGPFTKLAVLLLNQKQTQEALKFLNQALRINPGDREARRILIQYYRSLQQFAKAKVILETALKLEPDDQEWLAAMAEIYVDLEQKDEAAKLYLYLHQIKPEFLPAYHFLALYYLEHSQWQKAIAELEQQLKLTPDDLLAKRNMGLALYELERWEEAREFLFPLIQAGVADGFTHYLMGSIYSKQNLFYLAAHEFRTALNLGLNLVECYLGLVKILLEINEMKAAALVLEEASSQYPNHYPILKQYGLVLLRLKQPGPALKIFNRLLEYTLKDAQLCFYLGRTYLELNNFEMAVYYFKKALHLDPTLAEVYNYLGYIYSERGIELDHAIAWLHKAVELDPENGYYLDSLGWAYYKQGKYRLALEYVSQARDRLQTENQNVDSVIYDHLGDIYLQHANYPEALAAWKQALEQDPENRSIRQKMEKLLPMEEDPLHGSTPY